MNEELIKELVRKIDQLQKRVDYLEAVEKNTFSTVAVSDYLTAEGGLHVGGTSDPGTDNLIVDGTSTLTGNVDANAGIDVTGLTTTTGGVHVGGVSDPGTDNLQVDGTSTLTGNVDAGAGVDVTGLLTTTGGAHIGGTSDPSADNLQVDGTSQLDGIINAGSNINATGYVTALGGVHVGGTSDPTDDNLVVDGTSTLTGNVDANGGVDVTGLLTVTGDAYTVIWTDYSDSSTITGWSSYTYKEIYYKVIGKLIFVSFHIYGTSDSTSASFTIPYTVSNNPSTVNVGQVVIPVVDNGSSAFGFIYADKNTSVIYAVPSASGAYDDWTSSGNKRIRGEIWIVIQ